MNNKILVPICCVLAASLILGMTGVIDLGKKTEPKAADKLIGILVSREAPFESIGDDTELSAELKEMLANNTGNSDIVTPEESSAPEQRLSGVPAERTADDSFPEKYDYVFPGVEGVRLFNVSKITPESTDAADEAFCGIQRSLKDDSSYGISATLNCVPEGEGQPYFFNRIYQAADGSVYLIAEHDGHFLDKDHGSFQFNFSHSDSYTENGETTTETVSFNIKCKSVPKPVKITVCQYNTVHEMIQADEYLPGNVPADINPLPDAQMILVDTENKTANESERHTYAAYGRDDFFFKTLQYRDNGYCIENDHDIHWN